MKLPQNVLLFISYIRFSNVKSRAIIKVREVPSKSDSLDTITYECIFYAHQDFKGDTKRTFIMHVTNKEIKKWRRYEPEDAPLTINWGYLSDKFKEIAFGKKII